eukprot:304877_1
MHQSARIHTKSGKAAARRSPGEMMVLTESELHRMKGLLGPSQAEIDAQKEREFREHLRQKSEESFRASQRKATDKKKVEAAEAHDAALAQLARDKEDDSERRQAAIAKANKMIFEQE